MLSRDDLAWAWYGVSAEGDVDRAHATLIAAWNAPHRRYHGARHLRDCLVELDGVRGVARRPAEVELALWFHDAVYDPRATDNEARSADLARTMLVGPTDAVDRIAAMVNATATHEPETPDAALLCDIDLAVLGAEPAAFDAYEVAVRAEYDWVTDADWRAARTRVLRRFLERPRLYHTPEMATRYGDAARANLERALARLTTDQSPVAPTP